jgi:hypothetical protein
MAAAIASDHVADQERSRDQHAGAEIDQQRSRFAAQRDQTQHAGRNGQRAAEQAVGQDRLIGDELHRSGLRRNDAEAQPDAQAERPRQPIDHRSCGQRNRELQQHNHPGPGWSSDDLCRRDDRRIADRAGQRDRHRIVGEVDVPEGAA